MRASGIKSTERLQQVLGEVAELSNAELEKFLPQVLALRASRGRNVLPRREARLLETINRPLPTRMQAELDRLVQKRRDGALSQTEIHRLHRLTDRVESRDAERLRCLVELAGLRKTTLEKLMRVLGLKTPAYA
jgi:hypothetical protein